MKGSSVVSAYPRIIAALAASSNDDIPWAIQIVNSVRSGSRFARSIVSETFRLRHRDLNQVTSPGQDVPNDDSSVAPPAEVIESYVA